MPKRIYDEVADFVMKISSGAGVPAQPIAAQIVGSGSEASGRTLRRRAQETLHQFDSLEGMHGHLIQDLLVVGKKGTLCVKALNLFAFFIMRHCYHSRFSTSCMASSSAIAH